MRETRNAAGETPTLPGMRMLRNLVLTETLIVCITALLICHGYFELRFIELSVQIELAKAIGQSRSTGSGPEQKSRGKPTLQIIPEWDEGDAAPVQRERKL